MIYLILFVVGIIVALILSNQEQQEIAQKKIQAEKLENELKEYAVYSNSFQTGKVLTLKSHSKELSSTFMMRNKEQVFFAYEPVRYIYTSATAGRITTGGIEKTGGHNSVVMKNATEKCQLLYFGKEIEYIVLSDELYEEAQQSKIKQYLDNDQKRIIIVDTKKLNTAGMAGAILGTDNATTLNLYSYLSVEASRTYRQCNEIIDWICGGND